MHEEIFDNFIFYETQKQGHCNKCEKSASKGINNSFPKFKQKIPLKKSMHVILALIILHYYNNVKSIKRESI